MFTSAANRVHTPSEVVNKHRHRLCTSYYPTCAHGRKGLYTSSRDIQQEAILADTREWIIMQAKWMNILNESSENAIFGTRISLDGESLKFEVFIFVYYSACYTIKHTESTHFSLTYKIKYDSWYFLFLHNGDGIFFTFFPFFANAKVEELKVSLCKVLRTFTA